MLPAKNKSSYFIVVVKKSSYFPAIIDTEIYASSRTICEYGNHVEECSRALWTRTAQTPNKSSNRSRTDYLRGLCCFLAAKTHRNRQERCDMKSTLTKDNNVILVADIDCAAAIEYETSYTARGVYRDEWGHLYTAFTYSDALEEWIADYECGDFRVTVPGYVEYYLNYMKDYDTQIDRFNDRPVQIPGMIEE